MPWNSIMEYWNIQLASAFYILSAWSSISKFDFCIFLSKNYICVFASCTAYLVPSSGGQVDLCVQFATIELLLLSTDSTGDKSILVQLIVQVQSLYLNWWSFETSTKNLVIQFLKKLFNFALQWRHMSVMVFLIPGDTTVGPTACSS